MALSCPRLLEKIPYQLTAASGQVSEHGRAGQELVKSLEASQRLVPGAVGG